MLDAEIIRKIQERFYKDKVSIGKIASEFNITIADVMSALKEKTDYNSSTVSTKTSSTTGDTSMSKENTDYKMSTASTETSSPVSTQTMTSQPKKRGRPPKKKVEEKEEEEETEEEEEETKEDKKRGYVARLTSISVRPMILEYYQMFVDAGYKGNIGDWFSQLAYEWQYLARIRQWFKEQVKRLKSGDKVEPDTWRKLCLAMDEALTEEIEEPIDISKL